MPNNSPSVILCKEILDGTRMPFVLLQLPTTNMSDCCVWCWVESISQMEQEPVSDGAADLYWW